MPGSALEPFLKTDVMLAHFQSAGALPSDIDLLKIIATGTDRASLKTLRSFADSSSGPGADPIFSASSFLATCSGSTEKSESNFSLNTIEGEGIEVVSSLVKTELKKLLSRSAKKYFPLKFLLCPVLVF